MHIMHLYAEFAELPVHLVKEIPTRWATESGVTWPGTISTGS